MVDDDLTTIVVRTSTDNGATWSARSTVTAIGATKLSLAAAAAGDDDIVLFYAETDGTVYAVRWNGISWGTPAAWTNTAHKITGLATTYLPDWQVVVTGSLVSGEHFVWACRYGDGVNQTIDTWGALKVITSAALNAGFVFAAPAAAFSSDFRVFFVESFSGDEAYDRVQWTTLELTHDFNEEQWRGRWASTSRTWRAWPWCLVRPRCGSCRLPASGCRLYPGTRKSTSRATSSRPTSGSTRTAPRSSWS